jgi:hypothetical protein
VFNPDHIQILMIPDETPSPPPSRRACLVAGCPCKDGRLVSRRRTAFFAALARRNGETADRVVAVEPEWAIGAFAYLTEDAEAAA